MHRVERSVLVPYSAEEMFGLVAGVKDYPKFLPWCAGARLRPQPNGDIEATVQIDYRGVRSEFTTLNHNDAPRLIRMQLVAGPFRRLSGEWTFTQLRDDACKVHLNLHFQFATGIVGRAVAPVFEGIAGSMIDAFTRRAEAVYGMR
ncbi:MAG: type II toxin-antitoxin system RatA family toxin [Burkholderiales bacterium]|jgi:ribosome-associated toxin RatA of RatAB toxin-antitoxin module|nr:type II toxin-antitoxin system RatA family toxin [Burkholderiales bacterium]MCA3216287.1 type II toxin-antitoxin system RatA family toxin [Burkholderiales bacterium]MCA3221847.1 type II toxin-antitoxin system RatA family toxin [Burkholderiales bacterium]MCA3225759.1 type II toxin-antitoxin system RatA family toxin [Burkholderiales bacterium]MCE2644774.1 type II toxin-antitoxin system RatA family toxin [Burkholderiaceae bacterium]